MAALVFPGKIQSVAFLLYLTMISPRILQISPVEAYQFASAMSFSVFFRGFRGYK
jgi:hypothetical protein